MDEDNNWITWVIVIALVYGGYSFFGSDESSESKYTSPSSYTANSYYGYEDGYYDSYAEPEMENPYDDGSGHSAGYEWAMENEVDSCNGNSNSFIEGCEEYLEQQEELEEYEYGYEDDY